MKKLLVSDITKTIYLTNAKPIKDHPNLFEATGEKQDYTNEAIRAVFEWFMANFKENEPNEAFGVKFGDCPYILQMIKRAATQPRKAVSPMCDRLIELIHDSDLSLDSVRLADYLLANGVMLVDTNTVDFITNRKPIQTAFGMPLDELADLIRAKQEGRIIVPHCKVGDTVYQINNTPYVGEIYELEVFDVSLRKNKPYYETESIDFDDNAIGKSIFLTREEAEQALKGGEG